MNYSELAQMSLEDLRELNRIVIAAIKSKRSEAAYEAKQELYVGANVTVNHPKLAGKQLRVEKINRVKCVLKVLNGPGTWTVPINMISLNHMARPNSIIS